MGKRSWLNKLLEEKLLPILAELSEDDLGIAKAQELHSWLRSVWAERGFTELNQQQSLMDLTRRTIKDKFGDTHFTLKYIDFNEDEYIRLNDSKQRNVAQRNEDVKQIHKPDQIVATAVQLLDSQQWAEVAAGLAVLTGRRSSELLSTAQFEPKTPWSVTFTGALKRSGETQTLCFEIPTLTTSQKACSALEFIRHQLPDAQNLSAQQVNSRYGTAVVNACDRYFADLVPARDGGNLYTHLFRAVYATIATFWYCPAKVDPVEFRAAIQGHYAVLDAKNPSLRRSLTASRHYSDFEIADSVIAEYGGKRKGIKLGINGVEPLEVFKSQTTQAQTVSARRKHHSSLRIWKQDRDCVKTLLQYFPANTQPDSIAAWIAWSLSSLQSLEQETTLSENTTQVDGSHDGGTQPRVPLPDHTDSQPLTQLEKDKEKDQEKASQNTAVRNDIQSTTTTVSNEPVSSGLEAKLDRLVEVMTQFIGLQIQQSTTSQPPQYKTRTHASQRQEITTTSTESVAQPKSTYKTGVDDQMINAAIDAIIAHNNNQELHDLKWEITVNTLKAFSKNQRAIEKILGKGKDNPNVQRLNGHREAEIEQHHIQHGIQSGHNHRHKRKRKITDVIHIHLHTNS